MWIRLLKSHTLHNGKRLPLGKVLQVTSEFGQNLIAGDAAQTYEGPFPPLKMKTDFFKPKL